MKGGDIKRCRLFAVTDAHGRNVDVVAMED